MDKDVEKIICAAGLDKLEEDVVGDTLRSLGIKNNDLDRAGLIGLYSLKNLRQYFKISNTAFGEVCELFNNTRVVFKAFAANGEELALENYESYDEEPFRIFLTWQHRWDGTGVSKQYEVTAVHASKLLQKEWRDAGLWIIEGKELEVSLGMFKEGAPPRPMNK